MTNLAQQVSAFLIARAALAGGDRGQATVEYVGLVIVLGTGLGMIVAGLDSLGFVAKVGGKLIKGVTHALDAVMPG
ncbi:MAG: hypothetical protein JHC87_03185 [Thermoleophilaceae bacterium]|nr:hypothetical protein [Thermoleophilaceae bacterium]